MNNGFKEKPAPDALTLAIWLSTVLRVAPRDRDVLRSILSQEFRPGVLENVKSPEIYLPPAQLEVKDRAGSRIK